MNIIVYTTCFPSQSFVISLANPQNGAAVGDQNSVTVTITRNDDINGVFSFDMDSVLVSRATNYSYCISSS